MTTLESALAAVVAVRDCHATRRLCLDCWVWSQTNGEAAGLEYAAMLLAGVRRYQEHENMIRSWGKVQHDRA